MNTRERVESRSDEDAGRGAGRPGFVECFRTRRDHCRILLELSRRQQEFIEADDYTSLLSALGRKQRILGRMETAKRERPRLWQEWKESRETLDAKTRTACETLLAETDRLLAELLELEQSSTEDLVRRRNATRDQLQRVSRGAAANEAYRDGTAPATHRHLDVGG